MASTILALYFASITNEVILITINLHVYDL